RDMVSDVRVGQDVIIAADNCRVAIAGRAVDGDVFTEGVVIPDLGARSAAAPFQVLRFEADACKWEDFVAVAQGGVAIDHDVRVERAVFAERDVLTDHAIRSDPTARSDFRIRMNNGCRMDLDIIHALSASTSMKVTSASLTGSELTRQTPLALPILPRALVNSTSMMSVSPGRTGFGHLTHSAAM